MHSFNLTLAALVAASATVLWFLFRLYKVRTSHRDLPQPPHSSLWGHLPIMSGLAYRLAPNSHFQHFVTEIAQTYAFEGLFYLDLWPFADPLVFMIDPGLMNQITINMALPVHKVTNKFLAPYTGPDVVAAANGRTWRVIHDAIAPAFSSQAVRNLVPIFLQEASHFRASLDKYTSMNTTFSMQGLASIMVSDVINRVVFGTSADETKQAVLCDLGELVELADRQYSWNLLSQAKDFVSRQLVSRRLNRAVSSAIRNRLTRPGNGAKSDLSHHEPLDVLDLLLKSNATERKLDSLGRQAISRGEMDVLVTNCKGLLLGGSHTTRDTICYAFLILSTHPKVVEGLRKEHMNVFGPCTAEEMAVALSRNPHMLGELVYTQAVVKEVLRMFPIGFNPRQAGPDTKVTFHGKTFSLASLCVVNPAHTIQYSPLFWEKPSQFIPERFLNTPGRHGSDVTNNRAAFRVFGRGARACTGQNMALEEIKVLLLMTARFYNFESIGISPNAAPRVRYTDFDTVLGDVVFSEMAMDAKPRGDVVMKVSVSAL